jgi:polar amino acid transport system substrate-binding protein
MIHWRLKSAPIVTGNRWHWLLVTFVLIATGLPARAGAQPAPPPHDLSIIVKSGVLRIATTNYDLPAFRWKDGQSFIGPEIDLANGLATAMGVRVEFVPEATSFNGVVDLVAEGKADIGINKLSQTYTRLQLVRFSIPYLTLRHALLFSRARISTLSPSQPPEDVIRHLNGRLGAIRGTSYVDFGRRNFPAAKIIGMANWDEAIAALLDGRVDAIYRDEFEVLRTLQNRTALNVFVGAAILSDQNDFLSIAICNTCEKLQEFINFHLNQIQGTFTLRRMMAATSSH